MLLTWTQGTEDKLNYNGDVVVEPKVNQWKWKNTLILKSDGSSVDSGSNSSSSGNKFAYAYFRDELKAQPECNPDINILMKDKDSNNPYQRKIVEANDKYLGLGHSSRSNHTSYQAEWDKDYSMDLIGREYCRDRQLNDYQRKLRQFDFFGKTKKHNLLSHMKIGLESIS